jgi:hypothetical protein
MRIEGYSSRCEDGALPGATRQGKVLVKRAVEQNRLRRRWMGTIGMNGLNAASRKLRDGPQSVPRRCGERGIAAAPPSFVMESGWGLRRPASDVLVLVAAPRATPIRRNASFITLSSSGLRPKKFR